MGILQRRYAMTRFGKLELLAGAILFAAFCLRIPAAQPKHFLRYIEFQATVRTFKAAFEQRKDIDILDEPVVSSGTIVVSKPGKLWWNFDRPEKRQVVSDGKKIWDYDPELETVEVYDVSANPAILRAVNTFKQLLGIGGEKIINDYKVTTHAKDGNISFTLVPRTKELKKDIMQIVITTDTEYHLLETSFTASDKSQTRIKFSKLEENVPVDKTLFSFTPPAGVSVEYPMKKDRDKRK